MPVTGLMPLTKLQAAIEATPGTILPATRKQPILDGYLKEIAERHYPKEQRSSYIANYRSYQIKRHVEISGLQVALTFEDAPWWMQFFAKGGVAGVQIATSGAYTYTFTPTAGSNDLKTGNFELGDDTQNFSVPYVVGQRAEFGWVADGPLTCSMDFLGQRAEKQAATGALSDRVTEDINGALGKVYIDSTTIGSTLHGYPLAAKFILDNKYEPLFVGDGNIYPKEFFRGAARFMSGEVTLAFDSTAEWDKYVTSPGERKIRLLLEGTDAGGSNAKKFQVDWYGQYAEGSFGNQNGLRTVTFTGESIYNAGAGHDWRIVCVNSLPTLP